jgi:hypothetical protein
VYCQIVVCRARKIRIASRVASEGSFQWAWTGFQPSLSPSVYALPFREMIAVRAGMSGLPKPGRSGATRWNRSASSGISSRNM